MHCSQPSGKQSSSCTGVLAWEGACGWSSTGGRTLFRPRRLPVSIILDPSVSYRFFIAEFQWFLIALSVLKRRNEHWMTHEYKCHNDTCTKNAGRSSSLAIDTLSYLPGKSLAILAHWFPNWSWAWVKSLSSSSVHGDLLMLGSRWLCHRSRHCLPIRPFKCLAIRVHFFGP